MTQLPETPMQALMLMPSKAKEVAFFAKGIIENVKNGDTNPLAVLAVLRALELLSKEVREQIQDNINTAAEKYSEKKFEAFGALMEYCEVHTEYDYEVCGDTEWEYRNTDVEMSAIKRKEREAFLRAIKAPLTVVDEITGEVVTIKPPIKKSKTGVKVFLR